jgi:magnesium transporter
MVKNTLKDPVRDKRNRLSFKAGMPPGTLVHIGKENNQQVSFSLVRYNSETAEEIHVSSVKQCVDALKTGFITWVNVNGIHNTAVIEEIGKAFDLHPIVLEDIANTEQRPKFEDFDDYVFFTLKNLDFNKNERMINYDQMSFIFTDHLVISFQEKEQGLFDSIKERLLNGKSKTRSRGADFLVYLLIDAVVDTYFSVIEEQEVEIEHLEEEILKEVKNNSLKEIQNIKRDLIILLRSVYPLREGIAKLEKRESKFISDDTQMFYRDIYDHTIHIIESIETQRDILSGLMDIYLSSISNRMNSVMKVLTVIATIFIPITFLAGVYGMNFKVLPELGWDYGYLYFWLICAAAVIGMLVYFRRKKWL